MDEANGRLVDIGESTVGPEADLTVLQESQLMERLPEGVGAIGDAAYQGIAQLHPHGLGASPRKKPKGKPRAEQDKAYNAAFASRRIIVENTIGRMRRYQSITQTDRNHRQLHTPRVVAIAGLVNRQIDQRLPA